MSSEEPSKALVRTPGVAPDKSLKPVRHVRLHAEEAVPRPPVEVVTEEEKRHEEQVKHKAEIPKEFFRRTLRVDPPLAPGATVNCESLLGFLAAFDAILPSKENNYPILSSAKLLYDPGASTLFLEAGSHAVWTAVALKVSSGTDKGYQAMMPVARARNVLNALRDTHPNVVVGVDEHGIVLGPHTVPFGGLIDDFPVQPVIGEWVARAAMPAFYFKEICSRVLVARSEDFKEPALQGALLDFDFHEIEGVEHVLCTAVATDGARIHILRLPQMRVQVKQTHLRTLPPTITVSAGFFYYMREIIHHEWAALEFCNDQLIARGEDFIVVAKAASEGRSSMNELANWRKVNVDFPGYWLASAKKLEEVVKASTLSGTTEECRLQIDGPRETLTISSSNSEGERFSQSISVRCFDGPPMVSVVLSTKFLLDALAASMGGLVRLSFKRDLEEQATSPVVIRGEDEQFKAIIMPRN